jgi:hypothetical protein
MMTSETTDEGSNEQEDLEQYLVPTPEMELALGRVLLPLFAGYLQKRGLLEVAETQKTAQKRRRSDMTHEEAVNRIAGAQLAHEFRLSRIEDSFQQVAASIQQMIQIAGEPDGRLDALEDNQVQADARLDALIDSQTQLTKRLDAINGRFDKFADAIEALIAVQARADDQLRALLDHKGSTSKSNAGKAVKKSPRQATKKGAKNATKQVT